MSASLFSGCYPVVSTLRGYMEILLDDFQPSAVGDRGEFRRFLDTTIVGHGPVTRSHARAEPADTLSSNVVNIVGKILGEAVNRLDAGTKYNRLKRAAEQNVLTAGYTTRTENHENTVRGSNCLTNKHVNSAVLELDKTHWRMLHDHIGDRALEMLLTETSLFIFLRNQSYQQICGPPFICSSKKRKLTIEVDHIDEMLARDPSSDAPGQRDDDQPPPPKQPCNRRNRQPVEPSHFVAPADSCNIDILRRRMLYNMPTTTRCANSKHKKRLDWKLVSSFAFNRHDTAKDLLEHIFSQTPQFAVDPSPRLTALAARMLKLHRKFCYRLHLFKLCPAPWQTGNSKAAVDLDKSEDQRIESDSYHGTGSGSSQASGISATQSKEILEFLNLNSDPDSSLFSMSIPTELSPPTPEKTPLQSPVLEPFKPQKVPANLLEMASSHKQVFMFLQRCIQGVIPRDLIGGKKNHRELYKLLRLLIGAGCYDTLPLHDFIPRFVVDEVGSWLGDVDQEQQFGIYAGFIYWVLTEFVIQLVRSFFYATEASAKESTLYYYRSDVWANATKDAWHILVNDMYSKKRLGNPRYRHSRDVIQYHRMRLIPKETSFRAIVNMKRTYVLRQKFLTADSMRMTSDKYDQYSWFGSSYRHCEVLAAMRTLCAMHPKVAGSSVTCTNDVRARLQTYKNCEQVKHVLSNGGILYMAKCDIRRAFDTINQDKLLELLRERILSKDSNYALHKFWYASLGSDIDKRNAYRATHLSDVSSFEAVLRSMSKRSKQMIFGDWCESRFIYMEEIYQIIEKVVRENLVLSSIGMLEQHTGIPQGSTLSTMLCNLFYGQLEHEYLSPIVDPACTLIMRLVDDFLIVSTSREQVAEALERLTEGFPEYGCQLNADKTLANFDVSIGGRHVNRTFGDLFPWCGKLVSSKTLDVMIDFANMAQLGRIEHSMRISTPGLNQRGLLRHRMLSNVRPRMIPLFMDVGFNSIGTVRLNLYQHFVVCAKKLHVFYRLIPARSSQEQLFGVISDVIKTVYVMMRSACSNNGSFSAVDVTWLGLYAFYAVLLPKHARYVQLLKRIKAILDQPKFVRVGARLDTVVASPLNKTVLTIKY
ncbi:Telomerase reverse transcriptase [Coemansia interrupta]|uniref:Telomerase reverse transcriptase n=1 Tax=Coemansia interrupta TaxID=1126814 RepID=A0A9W8HQU8_9FUNG|nr:Telomerase reverse transcriptase [Coemansia interrupta]